MSPGQIRVNIFGTDYTLLSDDNEQYIREVAKYVDEKMREMDRNQAIKSTAKIAILTALNVADELFQERLYRKKLLEQLNTEAMKMNRTLSNSLQE